jgi:hypothetical protein
MNHGNSSPVQRFSENESRNGAGRRPVTPPAVFRPPQARFLTIPQTPVCYWLRERFFELLAGPTLGDVANVCQGLATADDERFVRFVWEVPPGEWAPYMPQRRWLPFEKGGGYGKWSGHHFWVVEWAHDGRRMKQVTIERYGNVGKRIYNERQYFKPGHTYSFMARGSVGLRELMPVGIFGAGTAAGVIPKQTNFRAISAVFNCRFSSFVVRSLSAKIQLNESYVARVPLPKHIPDSLAHIESACISLKRRLVALDPTERSFSDVQIGGASLTHAWQNLADETEGVAAVLHTLEGLSEREVFEAYGIAGEDLRAVLDETGTPAGWFPLIAGYDKVPGLPNRLSVPPELLVPLTREPRRTLAADELAAAKRRLRALYEAGPGAKTADEDVGPTEDDEDENEAAVSGARIPIPSETFLEELSQKLDLHPISVYWLLHELREEDGVVCQPELQRFVEDYVSVTVLRLLGHRWPKQIEANEPVPAWADKDGLIPLTDGTAEATLLDRVRARIAHDLGPERVNTIEREFEEIAGKPLGLWLATEFLPRHVSQFRKRPVAWQLTSLPGGNDRRRRRRAGRDAPVFSCLIYYHRLNADLLPKLRSHYVGPLRSRFQTELAGLEKLKDRTGDQETRRIELEEKIEELRAFDTKLEEVIVRGFHWDALDTFAAREPLDKWTSCDGRSEPPASREAFVGQERRYDPDLNDGVRVNIAPLQRAGLLAAEVLATKDVEKAIADRAQWRADERRWCRDGNLPRPGWWRGTSK